MKGEQELGRICGVSNGDVADEAAKLIVAGRLTIVINYFASGRWAIYCSACLYVCSLVYLKNHTSKLYKFFCTRVTGGHG